MGKILSPDNLGEIEKDKRIVLVGGCFDILHIGHKKFLQASKNEGDKLVILLESDEKVKKMKGEKRPINNIAKRAKTLSSLGYVDFVIALNGMTKNEEYDKLIVQINPDVIALTKGDANLSYRRSQAEKVGAIVVEVIDRMSEVSTTKLLG